MKKIKLAVLRENDENSCPFGLSIPEGCAKAGDLITKMAPLSILGEDAEEDEIEAIKTANRKLFNWNNPNSRCPFAMKLMEEKKIVECSYGTATEGLPDTVPFAAPFYAKTYNDTSIDGINTAPIGYYADHDMSRNLFYGIWSWSSNIKNNEVDDLIKLGISLLESIESGDL